MNLYSERDIVELYQTMNVQSDIFEKKKTSHIRLAPIKPHKLLDTLNERMSFKKDAELCRLLGVFGAVISNVRNRKIPVGPALLVRMHETTDISIRELKQLLAESAPSESHK
jgi:hypothetical protein